MSWLSLVTLSPENLRHELVQAEEVAYERCLFPERSPAWSMKVNKVNSGLTGRDQVLATVT